MFSQNFKNNNLGIGRYRPKKDGVLNFIRFVWITVTNSKEKSFQRWMTLK